MKYLIYKDNEHKTYRFIVITTIIVTFAWGAFREYSTQKKIESYETSQWVLNPSTGGVHRIKKEPITKESREVEYRSHIMLFYKNMFEFDQYTYKRNLNRASKLINLKDFKRLYAEQTKAQVKKYLEEHDIKTEIQINRIDLDMDSYPIRGRIEATQYQHALHFEKARRIDAQFIIEDLTGRSDDNPHRVNIAQFNFTNTKEIITNESTP